MKIPSAILETLTPEQAEALDHLSRHTYEETAAHMGWNKTKVFALALRTGQRKNEEAIRRRESLKRERDELLQELMGQTAKADVLDFMAALPDESVSMVLTSIPYNVGKAYGGSALIDRVRHVYYHGFIMQVLSEASRVLKKNGVLFLQVGTTRDWQEKRMPLDVLLFENIRQSGLDFQSRVVWTVPHGLTPKTRLAERYETALICSKGPDPVFNPTVARRPQKNPGKRAFKGPRKGELSGHPLGAWPTNVWDDIQNVGHNHPDRRFGDHPAQFPLRLAKRAVMLYTLPGDLVCDPFSGSGTTHVACIESGRAFIGADLYYEDVRAKRIARAKADGVSELPGVCDDGIAVWKAEARRIEAAATELPVGMEEAIIDGLFGPVQAAK